METTEENVATNQERNNTQQGAVLKTFGGPEQITTQVVARLEPTDYEIRVRVEASTISTTDTVIRKGMYPPLSALPPFVLGYDFTGTVDKLGSEVSGLRMGERVSGLSVTGGNSQYVCVPAQEAFKVSDKPTAAEVACLVLYGMTAYQMLHHYKTLKKGDRVLVHGGSGSVGNMLLQLGQHRGLSMTATGSASKHHLITPYGATAIDYRASDYLHQLRRAAGTGYDAVFDCTHHQSFNRSFDLLKKSGVLVTYGLLSDVSRVSRRTSLRFVRFGAKFGYLLAKLAVWRTLPNGKSAYFYDIKASKEKQPERFQSDLDYLCKLLETGSIVPRIAQKFLIEEVRQAHEMLTEGRARGHLVLTPNG